MLDALLGEHDEVGRERLEDRRLGPDLVGDHEMSVVAGQRSVTVLLPRRPLDRQDEPADEAAGHVLEDRQVGASSPVRHGNRAGRQQPVDRPREVVLAEIRRVRGTGQSVDHRHLGRRVEQPGVDGPGRDGVLDVVHRVRHVVGPVHDVGFETAHARFDAVPEPVVDRHVGRIHAELPGGPDGLAARPRVLRRRVEAGPGEVETGGTAVRVEALGLEPGEDAQRLGVPLEPADAGRDGVQRLLAVVTERRVAEVVGEARGVDDVRVAARARRRTPARSGRLRGSA